MTGLAASFGADTVPGAGPASTAAAVAIADALAARGTAAAGWRAGGAHLVVRAELPAVHRHAAGALLLDGDTAASALAARYAEGGAAALAAGSGSYALILADRDRDSLVLARGGDGPPLHWARQGPAVVLAGSEPAALLAAGLPAEPDQPVVRRFLATGACDDGPATFFAGVQRVLPGQVVEVTRGPAGCRVQVHAPAPAPAIDAGAALAAEDFTGRVGVRLGCGLGAAAVLGVALGASSRPRPLPVYSTTFPELAAVDSSAYCAATLLGPYGLGAARHRAVPFFVDEIDIDAYLADLGEPTPELTDWLCWALARRVAGEVDTLVDAAAGPQLSRLADRVASRFGVGLRLPLRDVPEAARRTELSTVVKRTLPSSAAGFAAATQPDRTTETMLPDLLRRLRVELVTTFLDPRLDPPGRPANRRAPGPAAALASVLTLLADGRVDAAALWRRYLIERWLRRPPLRTGQPDPPPTRRVDHGVSRRVAHQVHDRPAGTAAAGEWRPRPVRTELLQPGDKIPEKVAWYVSEAAPAPAEPPWYVLLAAKPAAVMQGQARDLWDIRPRLTARLIHRLAGGRLAAAGLAGGRPASPGLAMPWALQVTIEIGGWWRMLAVTLAAVLGRPGWAARLAGPPVRAVRQPRPDAAPPSHVAVVPAPTGPDRLAADVLAALRASLPDASYASLGGCAIVTDEVIGWAAREGAPPPPGGLAGVAALAATDPFGDDHTPIVIALPAAILTEHGSAGGEIPRS